MNYVFIHCTCMSIYKDILRDILHKIIFSSLYEKITKIYIFAILKDESETELREYVSQFGNKVELKKCQKKGYEDFTLNNIKNYTNDNDNVLYLHTKGVTKYDKSILDLGQYGAYQIDNLYDNVYDWVTLMLYFLIYKHEEALEYLKIYDVVGVNYYECPGTARHFSGNFWWAKASYIKTLEDCPENEENEIWILKNNYGSCKSMYNSIPNIFGYGHYFKAWKLTQYI